MARKPFGAAFKSAMDLSLEEEEARHTAERNGPSPSMSNPAVDKAKTAITGEDRQATRMISTNQVRMSRISDRIDPEEGLQSLIESIEEEGQRVPILVRRLPEGDYEIIYGRRRLLACRALGRDVRASVMELTDEDALIAQGTENNERLNTSFIEKALFAYRIELAGYSSQIIQKVMRVDESLVRKMRAIAAGIPEALIQRIGAAPGAGRRQWETLHQLCRTLGEVQSEALVEKVDLSLPSDQRLSRLLVQAAPTPTRKPADRVAVAGRVNSRRSGKNLLLSAKTKKDQAFLDHLDNRIAELHQEWEAGFE